MSFSNPGAGIQNADDVFFSTLATNDLFRYNASTSKWNNTPIVGLAALATQGGRETVSTVNATTNSTALNLANGNVFNVTLSANTTFAFNGATSGQACSFSLYLKQDGTGNRVASWPSGTGTTASPDVKWSGGAPTLSTAANAVDILVFESLDGGANWYGSLVGTNFV